jgi:hypothetical protein
LRIAEYGSPTTPFSMNGVTLAMLISGFTVRELVSTPSVEPDAGVEALAVLSAAVTAGLYAVVLPAAVTSLVEQVAEVVAVPGVQLKPMPVLNVVFGVKTYELASPPVAL